MQGFQFAFQEFTPCPLKGVPENHIRRRGSRPFPCATLRNSWQLHYGPGSELVRAIGKVLKSGKTLTICMGEVFSWKGGKLELIAAMQATMISVADVN